MNKIFLIAMSTSIALASCEQSNTNVLLNDRFDTPRGVPPFEQIKYSDYVPAFEDAIRQVDETIKLIVANRNAPTFENTIIPFDRRNEHLDVISNIFFNIRETDACDTLNIIAETVMPMLSANNDNVYMNKQLFGRIKSIYDARNESGLDSSQVRVVEEIYTDFVRNGALLGEAEQEQLRQYNTELSLLQLQFGNNLLEETNNSYRLVIDTVADLAGLPDAIVEAAAQRAEANGLSGKWLFTLHNASIMPFLQCAENHELRKAIFDAYSHRGNNGNNFDNKQNIIKTVTLRAKRAALLGYKSHAHYVIADKMSATPEAVDSFMNEIWAPALKKAKAELQEMKVFAYRYNRTTTIEPCDWWFWAEKVRKAKYDISESTLSEYFVLDNVREGLFSVANKLYGVTFKKGENIPLYNPENNVVYEVFEADGSFLGLVYFDWHPRASKGGGAWCTSFQEPIDNFDGTHTPAQVSIVCNFTQPTADKPALLTFDEVQTMFHEFGHGLHSLFSTGKYRRTAGVTPHDYVEMPSQLNEHWASEPEVMRQYARHYQTGDTIPDDMIAKIQRAATFNQGFATVEYIAASLLDLAWHSISADSVITDVNAFEANAMQKIGLIDEILPRYRSTYFAHIFDGGYSAGYYDYMWAELLSCDVYSAFVESGDIFNRELATKFRKYCLSEIGEDEAMTQYLKFRGQKPTADHLLKYRGLD